MRFLERCPVHGLGLDNAIPERRIGSLHRLEHHRHLLEIIKLAAEGQLFPGQALFDQAQGLRELARSVGRIDAKKSDLERGNATANA